jgi:uncharacterized protein (DUF362 family)
MTPRAPIPAALARCPGYDAPDLARAIPAVLSASGFAPAPGTRVLVKPNLVSRRGAPLSCTHPAVVAGACAWLLDHGAKPFVADSPAFGDALAVARACGLDRELARLNVPLTRLDHPQPLTTSFGETIGVSAVALQAEAILNLPRLKAHGQMYVTGAVKNLFGLAVGFRKALAHARWGEAENRFEAAILDILAACPPVHTLLDAVVAMHKSGPTGGEPCELGLLAASPDPVALDTAVYGLLGLSPAPIPLWREARARDLPGAWPENLSYPLERPEAFPGHLFQPPKRLMPVTFRPWRLLKGRVRSLLDRWK